MKVLKFYAPWCMPCTVMSKQIKELGEQVSQVLIEEINIDDIGTQPTTRKYGIRGIPVLVKVDEDGNEIKRATGTLQKEQLLEFLVG